MRIPESVPINGMEHKVDRVPEPVIHAHWETVPNRVLEHGEVEIRGTAERCSSCKHVSKDFKKWFDRCPNCGATMDKEEEQC